MILVHAFIKSRRRPALARFESGSGPAAIKGSVTPPSVILQREAADAAIDAALSALPEHYRAAIRWRLWDGLSFAQIGTRLGISDDCAQKLFGRARSPCCVAFWGPAMNRVDDGLQLPDENEPARRNRL